MASITAPRFTNEDEARKYLEAIRWPHGPVCPKCGSVGNAYQTKRAGLYRCGSKECRKDFTVTVGTVYERSHIPLHKWLLASYLLCSSKKGISSHQLHRMLGVTYKSAWFMTHRIREAMKPDSTPFPPIGGEGKTVEVDEMFVGGNESNKHAKDRKHLGRAGKQAVVSLVERGGKAISSHVQRVNTETLAPIMRGQMAPQTHLISDSAFHYKLLGMMYRKHEAVNHSKGEHARGNVHTNSVEGFFGIFKRGMSGVYQHCSEKHLQRYLAEFDFRYSNRVALGVHDDMRAELAVLGAEGKRLTYRSVCEDTRNV
jgi:transposase-like protein